jgi:hypothetical protein
MKNDKTMKTKTKIPTLKTAAAAPAAKAAPAAPSTPAVTALEAAPVRSQAVKTPAAQAPVVKTPAPATSTAVVATAPARPVTPPPVATPAHGRREITSDLIALRAYNLWEQQGRPQGHEVANWLLAESQLKQEVQAFTA